jgi:hypothetical protein
MKKKEINFSIGVLVITAIAYSFIGYAGNLEPPGPPDRGTMKTLDEVEPRIPISQDDIPLTINKPGSYYLTGNVVSLVTAITVEANDVTIDLMGYTIKGPNAGTTNYGIYISDSNNVEVRDGTIREFFKGIYGPSTSIEGCRVINVRATYNLNSGIHILGRSHLVKSCMVSNNGTSSFDEVYGIQVGGNALVTGNTSYNNGNRAGYVVRGISTGCGCVVTNNTSCNNGDSAISSVYAIYADYGSTVAGNTARDNGRSALLSVSGIHVEYGCAVIGNTAYNNGHSATGDVYGIYLAGHNLADQNTVYNNGYGAGTAINMNTSSATCAYGVNLAP